MCTQQQYDTSFIQLIDLACHLNSNVFIGNAMHSVDVIDSDDEAPEDIPLKESKAQVQAARQQQQVAQKAIELQRKKQQKERSLKNKQQQLESKKNIKGLKKIEETKTINEHHDSVIPQELSHDVLSLACEALPREQPSNFQQRRNKLKRFNDGDITELAVPKTKVNRKGKKSQNGIRAVYIESLSKKEVGQQARKFLRKHFTGERLKREQVPLAFKPFMKQ